MVLDPRLGKGGVLMIYSMRAFYDAVELIRSTTPASKMDDVERMLREALAQSGAVLEASE